MTIFCFLLQLEILQRQVTNLADTQNTVDDRTTRTKTEHAVLQARYDMLEENLREVIIFYDIFVFKFEAMIEPVFLF